MPILETIDTNHALATSNSCVLGVWRGVTTYPAVLEFRALSEAVVKRNTHKVGFLTIVERETVVPDEVTFAELSSIFQDIGHAIECSALVFEGKDFRVGAIRSVTRALKQLAGQPFPNDIFSSVPEAIEWMTTTSERLKSEQLESKVREMRSALDLLKRKTA